MNDSRTMTRQYSEYSDVFSTQRERKYEIDGEMTKIDIFSGQTT